MSSTSGFYFLQAFLISLAGMSVNLSAQIEPSPIIHSGMVVQRNHVIPLWGTAPAGTMIQAELNGSMDSAISNFSGKWELQLPPLEAGGPYELLLASESDTLLLTEVFIGDVWLASGQSNMAWTLLQSLNGENEIASSNFGQIRQFSVKKELKDHPVEDINRNSVWIPATPDFAGDFSAVGYYFGKYLHTHLGIPIGILNTSFGGTRIESWMSKEVLGYDESNIVFGEGQSFLQATVAFNAMLYPLTRIPIKGILWYQGESNMGSRENALLYAGQLRKLITSWRTLWSNDSLPFIWVQLPNIGNEASETDPGSWDAIPMLRAAQSRALDLPFTGEATTIDAGEPDIHPTNKEPVGKRLSLVARTLVYGDSIVSSGPRYKNHRLLNDGKIAVEFKHMEHGGLALDSESNSLRWFALAGSNGRWHQANAEIDSNRIIVWSNSIPEPEELRYAWESNPFNVNFYSADTLPAVPFKVKVNEPGFGVDFFTSTEYTIKKGESAVLTWLVYGAETSSLNFTEVDTIGGIRVWPRTDSTFTLRCQDRDQPGHWDSLSIRIHVIEPEPLISLSTDAGEIVAIGSEVNIHADVSAPLGGTISEVRFYINGLVIDTVSEAPFETLWIPDSAGYFALTGVVENHTGLTQVSDTIWKEADHLMILKFEAEDADISGSARIISDQLASGGKYVELFENWKIHFSGIAAGTEKQYQLAFSFMLPYGSPKAQNLLINNQYHSQLVFASSFTDRWENQFIRVPLSEGSNKVSLEELLGYMRLDYMTVALRDSSVNTTTQSPYTLLPLLEQNHPNPFHHQTKLSFFLPRRGHVKLDIFDLDGKKVMAVANRTFDAGRHVLPVIPEESLQGIYIIGLNYRGTRLFRKMVIL